MDLAVAIAFGSYHPKTLGSVPGSWAPNKPMAFQIDVNPVGRQKINQWSIVMRIHHPSIGRGVVRGTHGVGQCSSRLSVLLVVSN